MSNKVTLDNISGYNAVRAAGQNDVKRSGNEVIKPLEVAKTASEDKLEFSNRGTEVGRLVDQLKMQPDVRAEKVAALRDEIRAGEYNPSSQAIADAIIRDEKL